MAHFLKKQEKIGVENKMTKLYWSCTFKVFKDWLYRYKPNSGNLYWATVTVTRLHYI